MRCAQRGPSHQEAECKFGNQICWCLFLCLVSRVLFASARLAESYNSYMILEGALIQTLPVQTFNKWVED